MSLFSRIKAVRAVSLLQEEELYAAAALEMANGEIRSGLFARALAETGGDESSARAKYLKLRVETMKAERDLIEYATQQDRQPLPKSNASKPPRLEKQPLEDQPCAENDREKQVGRAAQFLHNIGYKIENKVDGYIIHEPLGGKTKPKNGPELILYANERGLDSGRELTRHSDSTESQATSPAEQSRAIETQIETAKEAGDWASVNDLLKKRYKLNNMS